MQGTLLYKYGSNGTATFIQLSLDHKASCPTVGISLQLHDVSGKKDRLQQILDALTGLCGNGNKLRISTPVGGNQLVLRELLLHSLYVCGGLINLVNGDNDLDSCCLCMVDRLDGLGHYAIIRCYHENRDIGGIGTTHTHCGEGLVSGCIQEGNVSAVQGNGISTDVLRDTAGFLIGHVGLTNRIEQGGFTMVYVTHDADNGRSLLQIFLVLLFLLQKLFDHVYLDFSLTEDLVFHGERLCLLKGDLLVQGYDLTFQEKLFDECSGLLPHFCCQILDGDGVGKNDHLDLLLNHFLLLLFRLDQTILAALCCLVLFIHVILFISLVFLLRKPSLILFTLLFHVLGRCFGREGILACAAVTAVSAAELTALSGSSALTAKAAASAVTASALVLTGSALTVLVVAALAVFVVATLAALTVVAALAVAIVAALTALAIIAALTVTIVATLTALTIVATLAVAIVATLAALTIIAALALAVAIVATLAALAIITALTLAIAIVAALAALTIITTLTVAIVAALTVTVAILTTLTIVAISLSCAIASYKRIVLTIVGIARIYLLRCSFSCRISLFTLHGRSGLLCGNVLCLCVCLFCDGSTLLHRCSLRIHVLCLCGLYCLICLSPLLFHGVYLLNLLIVRHHLHTGCGGRRGQRLDRRANRLLRTHIVVDRPVIIVVIAIILSATLLGIA